MPRQKRSFSREFREKAVGYVIDQEKSFEEKTVDSRFSIRGPQGRVCYTSPGEP